MTKKLQFDYELFPEHHLLFISLCFSIPVVIEICIQYNALIVLLHIQ